MSNELSYYENLAKVMLKTRGSRFVAAASLFVRERWSIATTSILTVFILSWSVFLVAKPEELGAGKVRYFGAISIIASVSVLTLTLLDYAFGRAVRAEKLQQNALKISVLMRSLERELCSSNPDIAVMRKLAEEYEQVVAEIQVNHAPSDFRKWQIESEEPKSLGQKLWWVVRLCAFNVAYYIPPVALHLLVLIVIVGATAYGLTR